MKIRTFWIILLRVLSLKLILNGFSIFVGIRVYLTQYGESFKTISESVFGSILYVSLIFILLFKTNNIIDLLRLDKGFSEERIDLNINIINVLRLGLIIVGFVLVFMFLSLVFSYYFSFLQNLSLSEFIPMLFVGALGIPMILFNKTIATFILRKIEEPI